MSEAVSPLEREEVRARLASELDRCVAFWIKYSHDTEHGGFFNCLTSSGEVYDDTKYCWLQGRQVWMYCSLYTSLERFRREEVREAAVRGGEFLIQHVKMEGGKCAFSTDREGQPIKVQRTIFSEVFYIMAMSGLWHLTGEEKYKTEGSSMMTRVVHWAGEGHLELGRPDLPGTVPASSLAVPMCLLSLLPLVSPLGWEKQGLQEELISQIHRHLQEGQVLEKVGPLGQLLPGSEGRLQSPGHAMECGWFLLDLAQRLGDASLADTAISSFIESPLEGGWDQEHGGVFYFMDAKSFSPTCLDWDMKLWWVHCEAMVATLKAWQYSGKTDHWKSFTKVMDYSFKHFCLDSKGDWVGYLDRQGRAKMDFKGGPYKGCFHLPRALLLCEQILAPTH